MPTTLPCGPAAWMDGPTYAAVNLRTSQIAASFLNETSAQVLGGVLPSGGGMAVSAGSGMSVNVATGYALCPSSSGSTYGGYLFGLTAGGSLTVATADPTNPRVDLVCAFANDLGNSGSLAYVEILTGTPTAGATLSNLLGAPSVASNGIVLAYVLVPAGSSSVSSGNVGDVRSFTVAQGGIQPLQNIASSDPAPFPGAYAHDFTSGRLMTNSAAGGGQPHVLPFPPQQFNVANSAAFSSGTITLQSCTINCDGNTDVEVIFKWAFGHCTSTTGSCWMQVEIDGVVVDQMLAACSNGDSVGGTQFYQTISGIDRPAAGSHTISITALYSSGTNNSIQGNRLYVRPVTL